MALPNKLRGKIFVLRISPFTCNSSACQYLQNMRNLLNYKWLFYAISCVLSTPHDIKNVKSRAPHTSAKPEGIIGQFFVSERTRPRLKNVQKTEIIRSSHEGEKPREGNEENHFSFNMGLRMVKATKN